MKPGGGEVLRRHVVHHDAKSKLWGTLQRVHTSQFDESLPFQPRRRLLQNYHSRLPFLHTTDVVWTMERHTSPEGLRLVRKNPHVHLLISSTGCSLNSRLQSKKTLNLVLSRPSIFSLFHLSAGFWLPLANSEADASQGLLS